MPSDGQTYGALLAGGLAAMYLSGIVCTQAFLYFRSFPGDPRKIRILVAVTWLLDILHSCFVCASVWHYVIGGLSDPLAIHRIFWTVSVTISFTGLTTFIIHGYFAHRVWTLSKRNIWITGIITLLAFLRMVSAFGTVAQMSRLHTWARFHEVAAWSFTTGLAISACVDFLIAFSLCYYLRKSRTGFSSMDQIIDSIMIYTIENGMLTSVSVVASFVCWLTMPRNFIFLALHFAITKMYANSLLATLNARRRLKDKSSHSVEQHNSFRLPTFFSSSKHTVRRSDIPRGEIPPVPQKLQINVEKSVHYVTDIGQGETEEIEVIEPAYLRRASSDSARSPFGDSPASSFARA